MKHRSTRMGPPNGLLFSHVVREIPGLFLSVFHLCFIGGYPAA